MRVPAKEQANDFLNGAVRGQGEMEEIEQERLRRAQDSGGLAKNTNDEEINNYSKNIACSAQATNIVSNPPSRDAISFLLKAVDYAQHPKGPTHTTKYGDLRGDSAPKQCGDNTYLSDAASMHDMDRQLAQK